MVSYARLAEMLGGLFGLKISEVPSPNGGPRSTPISVPLSQPVAYTAGAVSLQSAML
jgi:hypothetical protein